MAEIKGLGFRLASHHPTCGLLMYLEAQGLSKKVASGVKSILNGVSLVIALPITDLLSPLGLQVGV